MNSELMTQNGEENGRTGVAELRHDTRSTQKTKLIAVCLSRIYARGVKQTWRINSVETAVKSYGDERRLARGDGASVCLAVRL